MWDAAALRFLFIHQNFPGQFVHILRYLGDQGGHEIVFISEANEGQLPGVRRVVYRPARRPAEQTHPALRELEAAVYRAEAVARSARTLRDNLGYTPDIIIGHHGWGELLNLVDIYPDAPMLGYFEFFYHADRNDVGFDPEFPPVPELLPAVRLKNAVNLQALTLPGHGQTPTRFQLDTYPEWARPRISLVAEGVDIDQCKPDPTAARRRFTLKDVTVAPGEKLVTYVARDLEPYRGFHSFMRALPRVLDARPDARVILVGGDGVSYGAPCQGGSWRQALLGELGARLDLSRVHFVGKVAYPEYQALLRRSDAHVYLTYPFVASWSMREAMASGCAIVGSRTGPVEEFITDGETGRLVPFLDPRAIADGILEVLEDRALARRIRRQARRFAEDNLRLDQYLSTYEGVIRRVAGA
ncbi:glycosyltransferase [Acidomonas methanolica]|uniref:Glycosyl transferase n=1 Tax=Acidomonas methanolica NBRC 104435 TaxID=1231351 RepID=A0A023D277_ACIMT|nr:glycosyltransferase involved in cell wall biosynthesis [Acidomonas methanolica]GAJ27921.1 glycosyl transferase [Acidomonas methanolica NBRC 104435]GBQ50480.1 glycosyltransferase [Acidomonas methanolica]GEK98542.1 glycosyl transferase [Acidomonas methanolica NBRC 104435]